MENYDNPLAVVILTTNNVINTNVLTINYDDDDNGDDRFLFQITAVRDVKMMFMRS